MDPTLSEWLNLVLRWTHLITGIAWIGSSFFFNWLDSRITAPETPRKGIEGELWMVHSGGFYQVEKLQLAPEELPKTLHWFMWEAAFTWITGFFLLGLIYYLSADVYLIDASVADIGGGVAIVIGIATLGLSWLVYDRLWLSPLGRSRAVAAALSFALLVTLAYLLGQVFSARGAYVHVGAMLGTLMVANVWMRIIPAQRQLVAATKAGTAPDAAVAAGAKERSLHNNYMTLPVVFIMLSGHYPATYGHEHAWLVLVVLILVGAGVRHYFNLRNEGRSATGAWYLAASIAGTVALIALTLPPAADLATAETGSDETPVAFAEAQAVITHRCVSCHSATPADESFDKPPAGIAFDSGAQIQRLSDRIYARTVISKTMPLGNNTNMTQEERDLLGRWIRAGARRE